MIAYRKLTTAAIDPFIEMRINQLREEGEDDGTDLRPALNDYYARHLSDGTFVSWLATDGKTIVGASGMSFVEKPPYFACPSGRIGLLSSMYVAKSYRRRGIARRLLSLVVDEAREYGCGVVQIPRPIWERCSTPILVLCGTKILCNTNCSGMTRRVGFRADCA